MSKTKHTPGPWTASFERGSGQAEIISSRWILATVFKMKPDDNLLRTSTLKADARLMAAAPEILEALKELIYMAKEKDSPRDKDWRLFQRLLRESKGGIMAQKAIAKAEANN